MSSIVKLSIQGIRSFGTEYKDRGDVDFYTPLTLILGPNGTGKTTIIECLKYATTGELPPGGSQGAAFIHDPKIANESVVKAKVRLLIRDIKGGLVTVERNIEAIQKKTGASHKTLDGVLTRRREDGTKNSVSKRCVDLNVEMVNLLGVSRAVLDSVIFCHQEESNWPLSEGKALKTRFDEIFASTRYVKALDAISKLRKEKQIEIRTTQAEIKAAKETRDTANKYRDDLTEKEGALDAAEGTMKKINENLQPIVGNLRNIEERLCEIMDMKTEIEKLVTQRQEMERNIAELRKQIKEPFTGSTEELEDTIARSEQQMRDHKTELDKLGRDLQTLERSMQQVTSKKSELLRAHGKLEQEAEEHARHKARRDKMIQEAAKQLNIPGFHGPGDVARVEEFLRTLEQKAKQLLDEAKADKMKREQQEAELQRQIEAKRQEVTQHNTKLSMHREALKRNAAESRRLGEELSAAASSGQRLDSVQRELKQAEAELSRTETAVDMGALKEEITRLQDERNQLNSKLTQIDEQVSRLSREAEARTKLELLTKDRQSKQDALRRLRAKSDDVLASLLGGTVPESSVARHLERKMAAQSRELGALRMRIQSLRTQITMLETKKAHNKEQVDTKEKQLRDYEDRIRSVVNDGSDLETEADTAQTQLKEAQDNKGYLLGAQRVFEKYKEKLSREKDPPCPLCMRPFDDAAEVRQLVEDLESKLIQLPSRLDSAEQKIESKKRHHEAVLLLQPVHKEAEGLKKQLPTQRDQLDQLVKQIENLKADISQADEEQEALQSVESMARSVQSDASKMDEYQDEIADLTRRIEQASIGLSTTDSGVTLQQVQDERQDVQLQLGTVTMTLENRRKKREDHTELMQRLQAQVNDLKGERLKLETAQQSIVSLERQRDQLREDNAALQAQIEDAEDLLLPAQAEVSELETQKEGLTRAREAAWEQARSQNSELRSHTDAITAQHQQVTRYDIGERRAELTRSETEMEACERREAELAAERDRLNDRQTELRKLLDRQQTRRRELDDSLLVRRKERDIRALSEREQQSRQMMGGLDTSNLQSQRESLQQEAASHMRDKNRLEGRRVELIDSIERLRSSLSEKKYVEAEDTYRQELIKLRTNELAITDLDKYHKALDRAIMSYHRTKMDEINKIIRELWRNTYKGNDIDTIEIQSDEDAKAATATTRKTYNYRVVMIKGDNIALDMRGRCSAGQKVLASLIIRLALAETFCINCGILALDEPTTNLDRENIESLAYALVEIIKARAAQRNFQLVVITHDEDFVELLGRSEYVDKFFKVRKNAFGLSEVRPAKVQDLHTR